MGYMSSFTMTTDYLTTTTTVYTTIIGSLAAFEERFGDLWGHGLPIAELDEDQRYWRDLWMETRSKVLDNGNANLRAAQNEISQYTMSWNRYVTNYYQKDE